MHFFWGAPDLAVTRFSGRRRQQHPGGVPNLPDWVTRDAYSHEVSSARILDRRRRAPLPGVLLVRRIPNRPGSPTRRVAPFDAFYSADFREFILPYDAVRKSEAPDEIILEFLQTTYEAAARLSGWDRAALERGPDPQNTAA